MKKYIKILVTITCLFTGMNKALAARIDSIDMVHYDLSATIRNFTAKNIQCEAKLTAIIKYNGTNSVTLDLLKLNTTQVQANSIVLSFRITDSTLHINLDKNYNAGDTLRLSITYGGSPVLDGSWGGFYWSGNYAFNMGVGFTHDPHTFGRCLFPCIDNFTDKASYSFHITTDSGYMAVCSGLMQPTTVNPDGSSTWHWQLSQAIPTYIAGIAVGKYVLIQYNFTGKQSTYPVVIAVEAKDTANARVSFAKLNNALQCFEEKFGPYLFDRVGYVGVPFNSGAMEHAGNISYPIYAIDGTTNNETLFAHELSHHWFGNLVTCATAEDMWLNEGWAAYCEALFLECVYGKGAYLEDIGEKLFTVLRWAHVRDNGYRAVSGVPTKYTYGTHVYKKGALMVHTLRAVMGDQAFFEATRAYLLKYGFKNTASTDLRDEFQKHTSYDLTHFFNSWIYDKGHTDLQITGSKRIDANNTELYFQQVSRWKSELPTNIPVSIDFHYAKGQYSRQKLTLTSQNPHEFTGVVNTTSFENALFTTVYDDYAIMMGRTFDTSWINKNGLKTFPNTLFNLTVTAVPDTAFLYIEHHFAGPYQRDGLKPGNIRVSSERYWHIDGIIPGSFKATANFNYDGTTPASGNSGYLDNELITGLEDSIVLLYRANVSTPFSVHTDNTKQMAGNTDKTGRFTVSQLQKGDYVFGYYDKTASIGSGAMIERLFKVYPNPADDLVTIALQFDHNDAVAQVFDMNGKLVWEEKIGEQVKQFSIKTSGLKAGTYILYFNDNKGRSSTKFIIK